MLIAISIPALRGFTKFSALYDAMIDPREDPAIAAEVRARFIKNQASPRAYVLLNVLGDYERPPMIFVAHWSNVMRGYRRSPEFKAHMEASGVIDYWRRRGFPPQCRPKG